MYTESYDNLFTLKIHHSGNFISLPDRRYRYAVIEWYDLVDSKRFSIYEFDAMLEDLGIKGGSFLFSHFRIPGKSLDKGLVPLISHQDVLSLLKYVPSYKEIEVYVEKHMMKVVSGKGKGVVIEEIIEDDETGNIDSTSKVDHPPWSFESTNEKGIRGRVKNSMDPYDWQQDPYHGDDQAEENAKFVDALVVAVEEQLERIEHVVDEDIERPRKRKRENKDESASANVLPFRKIKQEEKVESNLEGREGNKRLWFRISCGMMEMQRFSSASNVIVECFKLLKELQDDELEKSRDMISSCC
ncbi:hypothetical protein Tco_0052725 [Tanacetum coccineum]